MARRCGCPKGYCHAKTDPPRVWESWYCQGLENENVPRRPGTGAKGPRAERNLPNTEPELLALLKPLEARCSAIRRRINTLRAIHGPHDTPLPGALAEKLGKPVIHDYKLDDPIPPLYLPGAGAAEINQKN